MNLIKINPLLFSIAFGLILVGCKTQKTHTTINADDIEIEYPSDVMDEDPMEDEEQAVAAKPIDFNTYNGSKKIEIDLLHTSLEVKFDYEEQHLYGKARIALKPYNKAIDSFSLDAKGMDILGVMLEEKGGSKELTYKYDDQKINIILDRNYKVSETINVFINYTAKPNELKNTSAEGGPITDKKGLYFINPLGEDITKPRQIWTQGETESSSCWFPTLEATNERMTTEIKMTIDTSEVSLSNGILVSSKNNGNGTKTDHWKMDKPHAPYLVMMAVGQFKIYKDKWKNLDVNYYLEKEYAPYAKNIFGNTPEMIEFFSKKLGVNYPWEKYSQIVTRDYVSGAMENTTAVIFYDELHKTAAEILDQNNDDIIAHELFHHWFGDLVTCESWAQLPLNESFATYGQYLWNEHKYGKTYADYKGSEDLLTYFREAKEKQVKMVRFNHDLPDDMFDAHSYQKGGRILHLLRKYVGDEVFFKGMGLYLSKNAYSAAEMSQFRIAMEEAAGEDLTWFFDQWFFTEGHPVLDIAYNYDTDFNTFSVSINQSNSAKQNVVYKIPTSILIKEGDKTRLVPITINNANFFQTIPVAADFKYAVLDPERILIARINEDNTTVQLQEILQDEHPFGLKLNTIQTMLSDGDTTGIFGVLQNLLVDNFFANRILGLSVIQQFEDSSLNIAMSSSLEKLVKNETENTTKAYGISVLGNLELEKNKSMFVDLMNNTNSPTIRNSAIDAVYALDTSIALNYARKNIKTEINKEPLFTMIYLLSQHDHSMELTQQIIRFSYMANANYKMSLTGITLTYLLGASLEQAEALMPILVHADYTKGYYLKYVLANTKEDLITKFQTLKASETDTNKIARIDKVISQIEGLSAE